jgi:hypothetical protein
VDDREHLCAADDTVDLEVARVEVDALLDCVLVVVGLEEPLLMCLVEPVDLVPHVFAQAIEFLFSEPLCMEVAPALVFDQELLLFRILSISLP